LHSSTGVVTTSRLGAGGKKEKWCLMLSIVMCMQHVCHSNDVKTDASGRIDSLNRVNEDLLSTRLQFP
jgi:hypothetical protein